MCLWFLNLIMYKCGFKWVGKHIDFVYIGVVHMFRLQDWSWIEAHVILLFFNGCPIIFFIKIYLNKQQMIYYLLFSIVFDYENHTIIFLVIKIKKITIRSI
jgi:hypothetical protein